MNSPEIPAIKDLIKNNAVFFDRFRAGIFYYEIYYWLSQDVQDGWSFPVPLEDIGDATLRESDKAIYFMRYIRKAIANGTFIPISNLEKN